MQGPPARTLAEAVEAMKMQRDAAQQISAELAAARNKEAQPQSERSS